MNGKFYTFLKHSFRKALNAAGFNLIRYNAFTSDEVLLQTIIKHFDITTVIDVGANEGQYGKQLIDNKYKGNIYSFEPIDSVFQKLRKTAESFPNWRVFNEGIGRNPGEMVINVSENLVSSSLLPIGKTSLDVEPKTRVTHQENVRISTIDTFISSNLALQKEILLKLDIQGFELEALNGAAESLSLLKVLQIELSLVPVYEGAPLYTDVIDFLSRRGFELYAVIPGFMDGTTGRLLQADGIFVNKQ